MHCLWCAEEIVPEMNWKSMLFLPKQQNLCKLCQNELIVLHGKRCVKCSRTSIDNICTDCLRWEKHFVMKDVLTWNYSIFAYNERMQEIIAKWKYRGDYCLGNMFRNEFAKAFKDKFRFFPKDAIVVPIPLSAERMKERGFNQAQMLADFLPCNNYPVLKRIHGEKQAKKTRKERISTVNPFGLIKKVNKPVILVDDIYTTGTTLRHAATLFKESGCPDVYALTLIRG